MQRPRKEGLGGQTKETTPGGRGHLKKSTVQTLPPPSKNPRLEEGRGRRWTPSGYSDLIYVVGVHPHRAAHATATQVAQRPHLGLVSRNAIIGCSY